MGRHITNRSSAFRRCAPPPDPKRLRPFGPLNSNVMQMKDWAILILACAVLPWLFVGVMYYESLLTFETKFFGLMGEPPYSELRRSLVISAFDVFGTLVVVVPLGAVLARFVTHKPLALALLFMAGYTVSYFLWGIVEQTEFSELVGVYVSLIVWPHVVLLGLSMFGFRTLYLRRFQSLA